MYMYCLSKHKRIAARLVITDAPDEVQFFAWSESPDCLPTARLSSFLLSCGWETNQDW